MNLEYLILFIISYVSNMCFSIYYNIPLVYRDITIISSISKPLPNTLLCRSLDCTSIIALFFFLSIGFTVFYYNVVIRFTIHHITSLLLLYRS